MRLGRWLRSYSPLGVPVESLDAERNAAADAYARVEELTPGPERAAAWQAFALQTYGDRLLAACERSGVVAFETAPFAARCFRLAASGSPPERVPQWQEPVRTHAQLVGMREALETLRADLAGCDETRLAAIDAERHAVDLLWIERAPDTIRTGLGRHLQHALDLAYKLGAERALGQTRR
jgi:hypothetical protein